MKIQYFATINDHKLREVNHILGYDLEKIHLELTEPQEMDVEVIARAKAAEAFQKTGKPVLVEDTGWYLEAWNGFPGAFVKWLVDTVSCDGILKMLGNEINRKATSKTALAFHDGVVVHVFVGEISGVVTTEKRGHSDFGYDRIFWPEGHDKTFGEMSVEEKGAISHRGIAVRKLKAFLEK